MDPGRPSALASCAVRAPFGDNAAVPFPWLRSSPWPRRRLMAEEESRGGYEEAQAMAAHTSEDGHRAGISAIASSGTSQNDTTAVMAMGGRGSSAEQ